MRDEPSLLTLSAGDFTDRLASAAPTPGGGSAAALSGAMAAALVEMVSRLSLGRADLADAEPLFRQVAEAAGDLRADLLAAVDRDAAAYDEVVAARRLPRETDADKAIRRRAIQAAAAGATVVPLEVARLAAEVLQLASRIADIGARGAASDVGVAAQMAMASLRGADLNVRINLSSLAADDPLRQDAPAELDRLEGSARATGREIMATVAERMAG